MPEPHQKPGIAPALLAAAQRDAEATEQGLRGAYAVALTSLHAQLMECQDSFAEVEASAMRTLEQLEAMHRERGEYHERAEGLREQFEVAQRVIEATRAHLALMLPPPRGRFPETDALFDALAAFDASYPAKERQ